MKEEMFRIYQMELDEMVEEIYNDRETVKDLERQLKAYKDKEDKLREYCRQFEYQGEYTELGRHFACRDILQILNEGDK